VAPWLVRRAMGSSGASVMITKTGADEADRR